MNPRRGIGLGQPLADHAEHDGVVHQLARIHRRLGLAGRAACAAATAARSRSPVEICGMPCCSTSRWDWVPLPEPGAPRRMIRMSTADRGHESAPRYRPGLSQVNETRVFGSGILRTPFFAAGAAAHEEICPEERVLCPVRRRLGRHQCLGLRSHRDRACASRSTSARSTPGGTASSARSPRISSTSAARAPPPSAA